MKKSISMAVAALFASFALSAEMANFGVEGNSGANWETMTAAIRFGFHDWKNTEYVDASIAFQAELRLKIPNTPIDLELRTHFASTTLEDAYLCYTYPYGTSSSMPSFYDYAEIGDIRQNGSGGSCQVLLNLNRNGSINPYIAVGGVYDCYTFEYDIYLKHYDRSGWMHWSDSYDDDGASYVIRAGLELYLDPLYAKAEASYMGEVYEGDDGQCQYLAILGMNLMNGWRIEAAGCYYDEWEECFYTLGFGWFF